MENTQILSVDDPIDHPTVLRALMPVVNRLAAMGLPMPGKAAPLVLSVRTMQRILETAARAGIGRDIATQSAAVTTALEAEPEAAARYFVTLAQVIEESPAPAIEWASMRAVFGDEMLESLLGVSRQSVIRYSKSERATPDDIADRLHWLAMVVADLAGGYNEFGIRRWFQRPRSALGERTPRQVLGTRWTSDSPGAKQVRALAAALLDIGAT